MTQTRLRLAAAKRVRLLAGERLEGKYVQTSGGRPGFQGISGSLGLTCRRK